MEVTPYIGINLNDHLKEKDNSEITNKRNMDTTKILEILNLIIKTIFPILCA